MNTTTTDRDIPLATGGERTIWTGTPSHLINLPQYLLWGAVFVALIVLGMTMWNSMMLNLPHGMVWLMVAFATVPLFIIAWKWLVLANTRYELTTQRLRTRTGVLNKHLEELELYRVRDYRLEQPFHLRLFSLANIILTSADRSTPIIVLRAVPRGETIREEMRTYVEESRRRRGVREVDLDQTSV
ncbi:MAG TPA: PH domain-containing protein [Steroidobacteraceae bacterium]|nr:PH domain-containing protein [Steroidobacteraceae bacterium]